MARKVATKTVERVGSMSLSDGCIMHRNQVIQRELNLHEVRKMMRVGKRLGIEMQGNEEEVESRRFWNSDGFDWVMKESTAASGGLLCVWDKLNFVKREVFTSDDFLGVSGEWGTKKLQCYFVNVYAPNDRRKKGGRIGENPEMSDFNAFIETTRLIDIRLANRWFTWYRSDGSSMSRLDRVLMTEEMFTMGGEWVQQGLRRTISDHCAILTKTKITDWGPKPFRVLDAWLESRSVWGYGSSLGASVALVGY
ncbi:hypothetical protein SLEP1_g51396 [Rubroshorea leprosula]|uniref:Uncharacterized protein n=1 Tax=Rubroshorea leprosula TaxID=152421 RepID=A0AAV5M324_9ROSI|nr:hypothetical protein SLEP1_g51396 [Rubroshorea leprosula]